MLADTSDGHDDLSSTQPCVFPSSSNVRLLLATTILTRLPTHHSTCKTSLASQEVTFGLGITRLPIHRSPPHTSLASPGLIRLTGPHSLLDFLAHAHPKKSNTSLASTSAFTPSSCTAGANGAKSGTIVDPGICNVTIRRSDCWKAMTDIVAEMSRRG